MVVLAWVIVIVVLSLWWLWRIDLPDRNPFATMRWYRLIVLVLFLAVMGLSYKAQLYRQELRFVIRTCR